MLRNTQTLTSLLLTPSLSFSLTHTHTHTHTPTYTTTPKKNLTSHPTSPTLCLAVSVSLWLLTDFLVSLQSRKASEQAKSVDSKTDSIGSGRAIPIKQVSSFPHFQPTFLIVTRVSMIPLCAIRCSFLSNSDMLCGEGSITVERLHDVVLVICYSNH